MAMYKIDETKMVRNILVNGKNRNKPCPCGSGKKAKKCHNQNYFRLKDFKQDEVDKKEVVNEDNN